MPRARMNPPTAIHIGGFIVVAQSPFSSCHLPTFDTAQDQEASAATYLRLVCIKPRASPKAPRTRTPTPT